MKYLYNMAIFNNENMAISEACRSENNGGQLIIMLMKENMKIMSMAWRM